MKGSLVQLFARCSWASLPVLLLSAFAAAFETPQPVAPQLPPSGSQSSASGLNGADGLSDYPVGPRDVLSVRVFDEPELAQESVVGHDGAIRFPLLGKVEVAGLTPPEIEKVLEHLLGERFLVDPQVFVRLQEYNSRRALVLGLVKNPGSYPVPGATTLLDLLSAAGGLADGVKSLVVLRGGNTGAHDAEGEAPVLVDAHRLLRLGDRALNMRIGHGDIVFAPQSDGIYVYGEVRRPGVVAFRDGLTVLQAVSLAEGLTNRASARKVHVLRAEGQGQTKIEVDLNRVARRGERDVELKPEDIVVVPQSLF